MSDLADCTATELLGRYRTREASPVEAVAACIDRIERVDGDIEAVLTLVGDRALAQAAESELRWFRGDARPFEGVPFGLKDIIATAGVATTGGSTLYRDLVPTEDASLAGRMVEAGGILLAKLQTGEFASGVANDRMFSTSRNPWALDRSPGGSSSGSGAAVGGRELPIAIGTDTGGSLRIPAAWCGVAGLKATFGRVPRHGVMGQSWHMDHAGPLARSVADCALTLGVIAGHDPRDVTSSQRPVGDYVGACERPVAGLRVGVPSTWFFDIIDPAIADAFESALAALEELGLTVVPVELPSFEHVAAVGWTVLYAEAHSLHEVHLPRVDGVGDSFARLLTVAPFVSASDYLKALRFRSVLQADLGRAFDACDVLATPGTVALPCPLDTMACDLGSAGVHPWLSVANRTTMPFNITGNPALVVPAGVVDGLPVSLQLVTRPYDEETAFAVGSAYESLTQHHLLAPPPLATAA